MSFSILERIDDVVTLHDRRRPCARQDFQYPRTDRRCCDFTSNSLSSNLTLSFSILERIDDVVTGGDLYRQARAIDFQYPRTDRRCCDIIYLLYVGYR